MRMYLSRLLGVALLLLGFLSLHPITFGQQEKTSIDESTLMRLYESSIRFPGDAYLEKRIADERERIREQIEEEVQASLKAAQRLIEKIRRGMR